MPEIMNNTQQQNNSTSGYTKNNFFEFMTKISKILILCFLQCFSLLQLNAQNYPEATYSRYYPFFTEGKGWSFVNLEGRFLGEYFDSIQYVDYEEVIVYKGDKMGCFLPNKHHQLLIPVEYESIKTLSDNEYFAVNNNDGKREFYIFHKNSLGSLKLPYDEVNCYGDEHKYKPNNPILDRTAEESYMPTKRYGHEYENDYNYNYDRKFHLLLYVAKGQGENRKMGVITTRGTEVIPVIYDEIEPLLTHGLVFVMQIDSLGNEKKGVFTNDGCELLPTTYDNIRLVRDNFVVVKSKENGRLYVETIQIDGEKVYNYRKKRIDEFKELKYGQKILSYERDGGNRIKDYVVNTRTNDTIFNAAGQIVEYKMKKFDKELLRVGMELNDITVLVRQTITGKTKHPVYDYENHLYLFEFYDSLGRLKLTIKNVFRGSSFYHYYLLSDQTHDYIIDMEKLAVIYKKRKWLSKKCNIENAKSNWKGKGYTRRYLDYEIENPYLTSYCTTFGNDSRALFSPQFYFFSEDGVLDIGIAYYSKRQGWLFADMELNVRNKVKLKRYDLWCLTHDYQSGDSLQYGIFMKPNSLKSTKTEDSTNSHLFLQKLKIANLYKNKIFVDVVDSVEYFGSNSYNEVRLYHTEKGIILRVSLNNADRIINYFSDSDTVISYHNWQKIDLIPSGLTYPLWLLSFTYAYQFTEGKFIETKSTYGREFIVRQYFYKDINNNTLFILDRTKPYQRILDAQGRPLTNDTIDYGVTGLFKTQYGYVLTIASDADNNQDVHIAGIFLDENRNYRIKYFEKETILGKNSGFYDWDSHSILFYEHDGKIDIQIGSYFYENASIRRVILYKYEKVAVVISSKGKEYWFANGLKSPYFVQEINKN